MMVKREVGTVVGSRVGAVLDAAGGCAGSVGDQTLTSVAFHRFSFH